MMQSTVVEKETGHKKRTKELHGAFIVVVVVSVLGQSNVKQ